MSGNNYAQILHSPLQEVVVVHAGCLPNCHLGNLVDDQTDDNVLTVPQKTHPALRLPHCNSLTSSTLQVFLLFRWLSSTGEKNKLKNSRSQPTKVVLTSQKKTRLPIPECNPSMTSREFHCLQQPIFLRRKLPRLFLQIFLTMGKFRDSDFLLIPP